MEVQTTKFKPSNIYIMLNNQLIQTEKKIEVFGYTGNKYTFHVNKLESLEINAYDVMAAVNRAYEVDILDSGRKHPKPAARKMFYFVLRELARTHLSLAKVGDLINWQDHATVLHHIRKSYGSLDIADKNFIYYLKAVCHFLKLELIVRKR